MRNASATVPRRTTARATAVTTRRAVSTRSRRPRTSGELAGFPLLLDLGLLPAEITQVVELGPADIAATVDLDLLDDRGVDGERALHADAAAHLADREGLLD